MKKVPTKKTPKKTTKKSLIGKVSLEQEVGRNTALLEEMRDNFRAFGQELVSLHKKTDVIFDEVGTIRVDLNQVKMRLDSVESDIADMRKEFKGMRLDVGTIKDEMKFVKSDIAEIKKTLTAKVDMKYIALFEARVARIEKKFV